MKSEYHTADEYLNSLSHQQRYVLTILRKVILSSIPNIKETMDYSIPTYKLKYKICAYAAHKNYYTLYIFDEELLEKYKSYFNKLSVGKNSIRFKTIEELPLKIIQEMLLSKTGQ